MSDDYVRNLLKWQDVCRYVNGFTTGQFLHFLDTFIRNPPRQAMVLEIEGKDLPEDVSSFPSPIPEFIEGYERLTTAGIRKYMEIYIVTMRRDDGELEFSVVIWVPEGDVNMEDPDFNPVNHIRICDAFYDMDKQHPILSQCALDDKGGLKMSVEDMFRFFNILAYEEVPITDSDSGTFHIVPQILRKKSGRN